MTDQQDLDVAKLESERFDIGAHEWDTCFEIAVDQNVTFGSGNEITCHALGAHVVKIARDAESWEGRGPIVSALVIVNGSTGETNNQKQTQYAKLEQDHDRQIDNIRTVHVKRSAVRVWMVERR